MNIVLVRIGNISAIWAAKPLGRIITIFHFGLSRPLYIFGIFFFKGIFKPNCIEFFVLIPWQPFIYMKEEVIGKEIPWRNRQIKNFTRLYTLLSENWENLLRYIMSIASKTRWMDIISMILIYIEVKCCLKCTGLEPLEIEDVAN